MAIPNYSGPPQFGYPNSEVAWYAFSPFKAEWLECILLSNQFASRAFEVFLYQSWVCSAVFIYAFQCCIHSSDSCLHWCLTWHFGARKSRLLLNGGLFISFMSRVPVLAGGGAIGTGYAAPYMTMEGTPSHMYYTQPAFYWFWMWNYVLIVCHMSTRVVTGKGDIKFMLCMIQILKIIKIDSQLSSSSELVFLWLMDM
jgi:hypothetical protein